MVKKCVGCGKEMSFFSRWRYIDLDRAMCLPCYYNYTTRLFALKVKIQKWKEEGYEVEEVDEMLDEIYEILHSWKNVKF